MEYLWAAEAATKAGGNGGYWHLAMVLAGIGLLALFARFRRTRAGPPPPTAKEMRERDKEPDRYRSLADQAMVSMLETASNLTAEVNTKARVLNRLIKEAEIQADRLEKVLAEIRELQAASESQADAESAPSAATTAASASGEGGGGRGRTDAGMGRRSDLLERIAFLQAEGKTPAEIAKATNLSTTEIAFAVKSMAAAAKKNTKPEG